MTKEPTLLRIGFRVEKPMFGAARVVLTAITQNRDLDRPYNQIYERDASPGDLARAVERGWIRTGEQHETEREKGG